VDRAAFEVVVSSGSLRPPEGVGIPMAHRWTDEGVVVQGQFTGAHLLLLAAAGCILNDVHREAGPLAITVHGVAVRATTSFDATTWVADGIEYEVEVDASATAAEVERLLARVDEVAEIPKALRAGTPVARRES
jgi:uncharacterized OsmC-like protein